MKSHLAKPTKFLVLALLLFSAHIVRGQYCTTGLYATGCAAFGDYIESFSTTGGTTNITNNNSNCAAAAGYSNYTTMTHTAMQGATVNFSLTVSNTLTVLDFEGFKIYVDWNADGDWVDPGEEMYVSALLPVGAIQTGSFVVPATATVGTTRMRVRMCYNITTTITPCGQETWGEAEDYSFTVTAACPAPTGVASSGVAATSANLSWNAVTGSLGYEYVLGTSATAPTGPGTATTATAYSASPLTPGTTYYFWVRNKCSATAFSSWSSVSFTTPAACVTPSAPVITNIQQSTATATWGAVPGSVNYEWAVTTTPAPPASGTPVTTTTYSPTSLSSGTMYYFHVRNLCAGNLYSAWSTTSFTTAYPPCIQPSTPTVSNINVNGATINWNAVAGSQGYEWVVTTSPTPPASGTATNNTIANATGLSGGTLYYVFVRNNCGPGGFSPWASTIFTTSSTCNKPSNIVITNITPNNADIQWDPVPGSAGFEYIIDKAPQAPSVAGVPIVYNRYSPAGLVSGTRYFLHLRTDCGGAGGLSPWVTVSFTTDTVCFAPVPVVHTVTGTSADIKWTPEANAQNYQYYVSTSIDPPFSGYATTAVNYHAKGLNKNTQYYMHLRSYCGGNDISAWQSAGFVTNEKTTAIKAAAGNDAFLDIFPNPVKDILVVKRTGNDATPGQVIISDIAGRVLRSLSITGEKAEINMGSLPAGVYIMKYKDEEHENNFKIMKE